MTLTLLLTDKALKALGSKPSVAAKKLLELAYTNGLSPTASPIGRHKLNIRLNDKQTIWITDGVSVLTGKQASALIMAALDFKEQQSKPVIIDYDDSIGVNFNDGRAWRDIQTEIIPELVLGLHSDKVIALEASTGAGKSAALLAAAVLDGRDALICAPTISILKQLVTEYLSFDITYDYVVILGRQTFVSEDLVHSSLDDLKPETQKEVKGWMTAQENGQVCPVFNTPWLASQLSEQVTLPDGWINTVTLDHIVSDVHCAGYQAYSRVKARAKTAKHVFCTHAMLAFDLVMRLKESRLNSEDYDSLNSEFQIAMEEYSDLALAQKKREILLKSTKQRAKTASGLFGKRILLVDEAHMLEANIANTLSDKIALSTTLKLVKQHNTKLVGMGSKAGTAATKALEKAFKAIVRESAKEDILYSVNLDSVGDGLKAVFTQFYTALKKFVATTKVRDKTILEMNRIFNDLNEGKKGYSAYISFSPNYRYPSLLTGRDSIAAPLSMLWESYMAAGLVSATLQVPSLGYDFVKRTLYIPTDRFIQGNSYETDWLKKNVTLHLPNVGRTQLCRPPSELPQGEWIEDVASHIDVITREAVGGTLVLTSSFSIINDLRLLVNNDTHSRVISQGGKQEYAQNEADFRNNDRPIWLATGRSWQGLDLRSDDDQELLTDLIIVNIPFGVSGSVGAHKRIEKIGFHNVVPYELAIKLKQGIGRLKREDDDTKRHIWLLDNRAVNGPKAKMGHYSTPMKVVQGYKIKHDIFPTGGNTMLSMG